MTCESCKDQVNRLVIHDTSLWCSRCHDATKGVAFGQAPGIATDGIPGGYYVKHGICHEDGTPRRFDSKSEIRQAAFEAGLTIGGETPKPNHKLQDAREAANSAKSN